MMKTTNIYLFDGPHWEVAPARTFESFFLALPSLVPLDSVICLADGAWDRALENFFQKNRCGIPDGIVRPNDFDNGIHLAATSDILNELAAMARHHAEPEIAMHVAVSHGVTELLEWFDVPSDPFSVSLKIPEANVVEFCAKLGVRYEKK
jgi:hypothetical protein